MTADIVTLTLTREQARCLIDVIEDALPLAVIEPPSSWANNDLVDLRKEVVGSLEEQLLMEPERSADETILDTVAFHTAWPGTGDQTASEATYTSYARTAVARGTSLLHVCLGIDIEKTR